jgi:type I restriction enzyme M protein
MTDRTHKELTDSEIQSIVGAYHRWRGISKTGNFEEYKDIPGFCRSVTIQEIREHKYALVPGRYVGFSSTEKPDLSHIDLKTELAAISARLEQITRSATKASNVLHSFTNGCPTF